MSIVSESDVLDVITAAGRRIALTRHLEAMPEEHLREVHALFYAARDEMPLEEARKLDRHESRDVVESTLLEKSTLGHFLAKAIASGLVAR